MSTDNAVQHDYAPSLNVDVAIIGAGPSGSIAASLLHAQGKRVVVLEKQHFPRFSIGESLLPCCMTVIEQANMLAAVEQAGFQFKNGAAFKYRDKYTQFDFTDKFTSGPGTTFQVERANFDKLLADEAQKQGVDIRYGHSVESIELQAEPRLVLINEQGQQQIVNAQFVLDASGFGRVLPRLLDLEKPSSLPSRSAVFNHIRDNITDKNFDRNKILISVHPDNQDIWYWLIPFSDGRCSVGVVGKAEQLEGLTTDDCDLNQVLTTMINQEPGLKQLLANAELINQSALLKGYSANVSTLATNKFALLGNAGEFLDPVFSSGVTIAMQSASMATKALIKQLDGHQVDWDQEYAAPLMKGVDTFRTYVEAWYDCRFQDAIFFDDPDPKVKQMICSILAGYAWDDTNPFVSESKRRLDMVVELCRS
ncbi:NAD(P)/FAD-dependent oxidoreductase [Shewanella fidelis]|uniref:NAD(P)/FAD-dependent oxidoreductase n=1 Tax=Shewanella fidelis TaxID=173509 RepID=A0AAW8NQM1_9GAMM|nr:NAD(P)/FAD-dependent oxidoreductase [Shewanella fidelis]MDR8525509.1 NAD(P)/FAD-dependent oxidoreductase [Shewanella fidelis]MDW4813172.1 NAD(P)/FAD-dependent oxidoreductase [Shewanella fidelis]MDW4816948.1 NAD(P)/FAD-dependent oxidoreductase [Shewanella fidelis]MDW4820107.1 NAD(P)/FAD-dependent oxidoreductase [Shewanella fidelis]MDW4825637.1 NAD(P)/FAD-dependent oxidoreductase [Shewanella fidelis]